MQRSKEKSYVVEFPLVTEKYQEDEIDTRFDCGRMIYNALVTVTMKRYGEMIKTKLYRWLMAELFDINTKLKNKDDEKEKCISVKKKEIRDKLTKLRNEYRINEYAFQLDVKEMQWHYKSKIHSQIAQNIATNVWRAYEKLMFGDGKLIRYKKHGQTNSLSGKTNETGIVFRDDYIVWGKLKLKVKIDYRNPYEAAAMRERIAYCRIVRKFVRGRYKYYVQVLLKGLSPAKTDKETGELKNGLGTGDVGLDIGTQTIAISSVLSVKLYELADRVQKQEDVKRRLRRKMDRSRRSTNPDNFNEDGTIKKQGSNKVIWVRSNGYKKVQGELREICRKQSAVRKGQHQLLANEIISLGNKIYVEEMNFKGLQKRAKKTEQNEDGKFKRKKRFGKSIANKAPAMLLTIVKQKLERQGETLYKVNTREVKASQYNHETDDYTKKKLSERWNDINSEKVQRDMYSAFLLMNVGSDLKSIDKEKCNERYANFKVKHDEEVQMLASKRNISSIGI